MSEAVQTLFDEISPRYDRLNRSLSFSLDKLWRKRSLDLVHFSPNQSIKVLDLCAGTHDLGIAIQKKFPKSQVFGLDFSLGMLQAGQEKIKNYYQNGKIIPVCGDVLNLPFSDNSFDFVTCAFGVRNLDNFESGLQEIKRVLKPGGQILILEFFRPTSLKGRFFQMTYAQVVIPTVGRWLSGHGQAYTYLRDSIRRFMSVKEFNNLLYKLDYKVLINKNFNFDVATAVIGQKA